ncbi:MAG: hypothetical protein AAF654_06670 [Myxococcota bacterium]
MLNESKLSGIFAATVFAAGFSSACSNDTIDEAATFTVRGDVEDTSAEPLASADIRLIRFFHPLKLFEPSFEDFLTCDAADCGYPGIDLEIERVRSGFSGADGAFEFEVLGADIAADQGVTDAQGLVEGSNLVVVAFDPSDATGRSGTITYDNTFSQADRIWETGTLDLWNAEAEIDVSQAITSGVAQLQWNPIPQPAGSNVRRFYEVVVGSGANRLAVRCSAEADGTVTAPCANQNTVDGTVITLDLSAVLLSLYGNNAGTGIEAHVRASGADYRYAARFTLVNPLPDFDTIRQPAGISGVWASSATDDFSLIGTPALDGDPNTAQSITNEADTIYVQLNGSSVTDAGILGSLVNDAFQSCVVIEFNSSNFDTITDAKANTSGWANQGRFCGGNGSDQALSALVNFSNSQIAAWMRFRLDPDPGANAFYLSVGEVAVFDEM